jgi:hypothetical protein
MSTVRRSSIFCRWPVKLLCPEGSREVNMEEENVDREKDVDEDAYEEDMVEEDADEEKDVVLNSIFLKVLDELSWQRYQ